MLFEQMSSKSQQKNKFFEQNHYFNVNTLKSLKSAKQIIKNQCSSYKISRKSIQIPSSQINEQIQIYQWRLNTQLPISKIYTYKHLSMQQNIKKTQNQVMILEISYQAPFLKLSQITMLPLFQILYMLKQTFVGLQRLFDKFGWFTVNSQMIFLNRSYKCKVWINKNPLLNRPQNNLIDQVDKLFSLKQIIRIFEQKTIKSSKSLQFYDEVYECQNIIQVIQKLDLFAEKNKILVAKSVKISSQKKNQEMDNNLMGYSLKNLSKVPKFIYEKNSQQNNQKSQYYFYDKYPQKLSSRNQNNQINESKSFKYLNNLRRSTFTKIQNKKTLNHYKSRESYGEQLYCKLKSFKSYKVLGNKFNEINGISSIRTKEYYGYEECYENSQNILLNNNKDINEFSRGHSKYSKCDTNDWRNKKSNNKSRKVKIIETPKVTGCRYRKFSNDKFIQINRIKNINEKLNNFKIKSMNFLTNPKIYQDEEEDHQHKELIVNDKNYKNDKINIKKSSQTAQSINKVLIINNQIKQNIPSPIKFTQTIQQNGWKTNINTLFTNRLQSLKQSIIVGRQQRSINMVSTADFMQLSKYGRTIHSQLISQTQIMRENQINNNNNNKRLK